MGLKTKGFDDLDKTLNALGSVGRKVGQKAVREGMKPILEQMKKDAPNNPKGISPLGLTYKKTKGAKALKVTKVKTYAKTGTTIIRAGIDKSNWDETKHLYFHHYGYENKGLKGRFEGVQVNTHVGWVTKSFNHKKEEGMKRMTEVVQSEINNIIGK